MSDRTGGKAGPSLTGTPAAAKAAREARLADALRANLRRRKAQERARSEAPADPASPAGPDPDPAADRGSAPAGRARA